MACFSAGVAVANSVARSRPKKLASQCAWPRAPAVVAPRRFLIAVATTCASGAPAPSSGSPRPVDGRKLTSSPW
jgi:hypothetical protein